MKHAAFYRFPRTGTPEQLNSVRQAAEPGDEGTFVWLNFVMPERAELDEVIPAFGIHHLSVDDCFDEDQIPKIDIFGEYTSILFNDIGWESGEARVIELNAFLGKNFLITVMRDGTADRCPERFVLGEPGHSASHSAPGPARLLYIILDRLVDLTFDAVDKSADLVASLEDRLMAGTEGIKPAELQSVRKNLVTMRKSLFHEREILERICRKDSDFIPEANLIYFNDIYDHLSKFAGMVESDRETLTSLAQMQLAITNNRAAEAANRTNRSVSRLTLITTICMPLSLIAGIGGMSEWTMMTGADNWKLSYSALLAFMALTGFANYALLKWIDRRKSTTPEQAPGYVGYAK